ncbi:MAG: hypothetical protein C4534_02620 [Gaiellales bacterium]|nr:MAG: hypothetical protein C4534_02620 [Gaiellales bacterium]
MALTAAAFMLLVLALTAGGCSKEEGSGSDTGTGTQATTTTTTEELSEDWLATRAASKIGGPHLLRDVAITDTGGDKTVKIEVDRPELCHDGAVVGTMAVFAQNMMGILYKKYPEVSDVEIVLYGPEQGIVSDEVAMSVSVNRASAQSIDWFEFDESNILELATSYYMHPKIEESYRLEGALPYDQQDQ